jgi:hypothetical protein
VNPIPDNLLQTEEMIVIHVRGNLAHRACQLVQVLLHIKHCLKGTATRHVLRFFDLVSYKQKIVGKTFFFVGILKATREN